jgi:uncharacterized protein
MKFMPIGSMLFGAGHYRRMGWLLLFGPAHACLPWYGRYIMQTLICKTIFYGHGFGLFGKLERTGQITIVVAVWIF